MTRNRLLTLLASLVAILGGCTDRPSPLIICHNANCNAPTNPNLDDTMQALRQSLAMTWNGAPLLDGVEIDTVWHAEAGRCAFAHDALSAGGGADALEPAMELATHLTETADLVGDRRFYVKLEQKPLVAPDSRPHTALEAVAHAKCSLDFYDVIAAAADASDRNVTVLFESEDPALVLAIAKHSRYPGKRPGERIQTGLMIPIDQVPPAGVVVDVVSINWESFHDGKARALRDLRGRGVGIMLWMYDAGIEVLSTVESMRPDFVTTGEAALIREWMGPRD